MVSYSRRKL
uniref:Uncharacterized protein n=1 Tax=Anguilla anguilla TaxID=7936 RepID=A0A0E9QYQ9_ANGAN